MDRRQHRRATRVPVMSLAEAVPASVTSFHVWTALLLYDQVVLIVKAPGGVVDPHLWRDAVFTGR